MAESLYIILLLWTLRCAGSLEVKEESSIQVAFANEIINASCKVTFACTEERLEFNISYFWINLKGKKIPVSYKEVHEMIPKDCANRTMTKLYSLPIKPASHNSVSGAYYCKAEWKTTIKTGYGTFILFRDKGYEEPHNIMWMLLIAFTIVLAVLSIMGTGLLFWKREDLKPHQSNIYEAIENDASSASSTTHQKMPTAEVFGQETQGKTQDFYENNITDVYENI